MGNCKLSPLVFADYLFVAGISDSTSASSLQTILANFHFYMGLSINNEKSIICGIHSHNLHAFQEVLGIQLVSLPIRYLVLPLVRVPHG